MKQHLYKHGLPFSAKLAEALLDQKLRVKAKFSSMIILDGLMGVGKTTLGVECADFLTICDTSFFDWDEYWKRWVFNPEKWKKNGLPNQKLIDFDSQLGMGGSEFLKKLRICYDQQLVVVMYDEAGDFNKRGALTRFNALLNRTFETFRAFKIIVILLLPNFCVLDQDLFDKGVPRMLINCYGRSEEYGNFRVYSVSKMLYIRERMKKMVIRSAAYGYEEPNFQGHFLDLPEDRSKELDKFSTKGKIKELRGAELKAEGLMSYNELAQKLSRSVVWVRMICSKLKLKPKRIVDRRAYFEQTVVDDLANYLDDISPKGDKGERRR